MVYCLSGVHSGQSGAKEGLCKLRLWEQDRGAGLGEQRVSGNWQPDLINMPGLFWVARKEGGVGGRDSVIGTLNFPSTPSSAPGLLS